MNNRSNLAVSMLAAALLVLQACGEDTRQTQSTVDRTVPVVVAPLELDRASTRLEAVGTSRALQSIELHPATSGEVTAVNFQPGQQVSAGDVLVELERRDEELALSLAEVQLKDAERLYDRYERTGSTGAVLPTQMDAARTAVDAARIQVERARVALEYRTIAAPFDGYVGITDVDRGDRINPDSVITTLDNRDSLLVSFSVPEALIGELAVGDDVSVSTWTSRGPTATGRVVDIGSRINPATRTFEARASVDNKTDELRPGMSFRVSMNLEGTAYPVITETAVQWGADGAYIWTVVDGRAHRVSVNVVQRQQGVVLVDAPLEAGDLVVV
jgi:RND family efflux transporter MFP subunit